MFETGTLHYQLIITVALISATTFVHGVVIASAGFIFRGRRSVDGVARFFRDSMALVFVTLMLMAAHGVHMWMWAVLFLHLDLFATAEAAFYFASVSYTTLGFGDVLLAEEWRLLSGGAAANGLLMFGLSAAFMLEVFDRLRMAGRS